MANFAAERPQFFEGQYLGADDLAAIVEYLRTTTARQNLGQHSWGVAIGLELVSQPVSDTTVEYYVQPGVAIDGYGRLIVVSNPARVEASQFVSIGSGTVDVWIRYDQGEFSATRPGFNACASTDDYARINETFRLVVGTKPSILDRQSGVTVNDTALVDAREALLSVDPDARLLCDASVPHQEFPVDDENAYWLIPLGHVKWSSASSSFLPLVDAAEAAALDSGSGTRTPDQVYEALMASRTKRRLIGVVAESILAADGLIRLRERTAAPDPVNGNDAVCAALQLQGSDLHFCDGQLKPKELVWLEGNVRIEGDARLLNGRLEFKDAEGRDYIQRTVQGSMVSPIVPALLQRSDGNSKGGTDLQLLLGKSTNGSNRFTVGNIRFEGSDLCDLSVTPENRVVIQDNGRMGIGTLGPDSVLAAPLSIRGLKETITENAGTPEESTSDIYRLQSHEAEDGSSQWQMDLRDTEGATRKSLNFTETALAASRLFLETGGNIGIGTTEPTEQLHVRGNDPGLFIDSTAASGLHRTELKFGGDGATQAGMYWSKNPERVVIHHNNINSVAIDRQKIGLGTLNPLATLHVATGTDASLGAGSGYLLLGDTNDLNLVLDNNEIQARSNGAAAQLHLQVAGGDFSVHWNNPSEFRIRDNGDVGIGTNSPTAKLDVRGDIKLGPTGNLFALASVESLRTVVGRVGASGNVEQGAGYSVSKGLTGDYLLSFSPSFAATPVVVASSYGDADNIVSIQSISASTCLIRITDIRSRAEILANTEATQPEDNAFTFIAIGAR